MRLFLASREEPESVLPDEAKRTQREHRVLFPYREEYGHPGLYLEKGSLYSLYRRERNSLLVREKESASSLYYKRRVTLSF